MILRYIRQHCYIRSKVFYIIQLENCLSLPHTILSDLLLPASQLNKFNISYQLA